MVYVVHSNRPIVSSKPIKTKRVVSEHAKQMQEFFRTHDISVTEDANGETVVVVKDLGKEE